MTKKSCLHFIVPREWSVCQCQISPISLRESNTKKVLFCIEHRAFCECFSIQFCGAAGTAHKKPSRKYFTVWKEQQKVPGHIQQRNRRPYAWVSCRNQLYICRQVYYLVDRSTRLIYGWFCVYTYNKDATQYKQQDYY